MTVTVWEAIFMLLVLKIPVIYLAAVVWWAVRAEPHPAAGSDEAPVPAPIEPCGWSDWQRRRLRPLGRRPRPSAPRARARAQAV